MELFMQEKKYKIAAILPLIAILFCAEALVSMNEAKAAVISLDPSVRTKTIVPFASDHYCAWGGDYYQCVCPDNSVICGFRATTTDNKGNAKFNMAYCCPLTQEALDAGYGATGPGHDADGGGGALGQPIFCKDAGVSVTTPPPSQVLIGVRKFGASNQFDFGECRNFTTPLASYRLIDAGTNVGTDYMCSEDEVACGAKNAPDKNDSWNAFYCCKLDTAKVTVRAIMEEDPDTSVGGVDFTLEEPNRTTSKQTSYSNGFADEGLFTLSTPPASASKFPGYTCSMYSTADATEVPCATSTTAGSVQKGQTLEFTIKYKKPSCLPKTCTQVGAGGAECGKFDDGCGEELDCGMCNVAGQTCSGAGKCVSPFDVSCKATPGQIAAGQSADFSVNTANGTEPITCAWQSSLSEVAGETSCAFNAVISTPGTHDITVDITDSSSPAKSGTATCHIEVSAGPTPTPVPVKPIIPNYALCEAYKFIQFYGSILFVIVTVIGGWMVMTSGGDPNRVTRGKQALTAGAGGLLVLLLAKPVFTVIIGFLGFTVLLCGKTIP